MLKKFLSGLVLFFLSLYIQSNNTESKVEVTSSHELLSAEEVRQLELEVTRQ